MSITYYYSDVLNFISSAVPRIVDSDKAPYIANFAINEIWKQYDWRQSLATLNPFYLIPGEQLYGAPMVVIPSDFLGLRKTYLTRYNSNPVFRADVTVMKDLEDTHLSSLPGQICYEPARRAFKVFPRTPNNIGCPDYAIAGQYKKVTPKVTSSTLSSTFLPFSDDYLFNMAEVFKWAAWHAAGDPRAGGVTSNNHGMTQYTGQYAAAQEAIDQMAETEGFELGDVALAPKESLAITSTNSGGLSFGIYNRIFS